jgi:hypothetical protein
VLLITLSSCYNKGVGNDCWRCTTDGLIQKLGFEWLLKDGKETIFPPYQNMPGFEIAIL